MGPTPPGTLCWVSALSLHPSARQSHGEPPETPTVCAPALAGILVRSAGLAPGPGLPGTSLDCSGSGQVTAELGLGVDAAPLPQPGSWNSFL